jgi:Protein of unknown function (DUF1062)
VRSIPRALLDGYQRNDHGLVATVLADPSFRRRNRLTLDLDGTWELEREPLPPPERLVTVRVEFTDPLAVPTVQLIAAGLGISRNQVECLLETGGSGRRRAWTARPPRASASPSTEIWLHGRAGRGDRRGVSWIDRFLRLGLLEHLEMADAEAIDLHLAELELLDGGPPDGQPADGDGAQRQQADGTADQRGEAERRGAGGGRAGGRGTGCACADRGPGLGGTGSGERGPWHPRGSFLSGWALLVERWDGYFGHRNPAPPARA